MGRSGDEKANCLRAHPEVCMLCVGETPSNVRHVHDGDMLRQCCAARPRLSWMTGRAKNPCAMLAQPARYARQYASVRCGGRAFAGDYRCLENRCAGDHGQRKAAERTGKKKSNRVEGRRLRLGAKKGASTARWVWCEGGFLEWKRCFAADVEQAAGCGGCRGASGVCGKTARKQRGCRTRSSRR